MASKASGPAEDFSCRVCHNIFKDPLMLLCSHSFCQACLHGWWRDKGKRECPVCKKCQKIDPPLNRSLKDLCEAFIQERHQRASSVCVLHDKKLGLFCLRCQQLVCLLCRDSKRHSGHIFRPIDEVATEHKEEVRKLLKPLQDKLMDFNEAETIYDKTAKHIKDLAFRMETQMKEQFEKMHEFLRVEEEARTIALAEEEEQKIQMMKEHIESLDRNIPIISDKISAIEEELRAEPISFLQNYKTTVEGLTLQDPQLSGALIDKAKHLGNLAFRVWDKMKDIVSYTPVILDPNTAHPKLILSDDLTTVKCGAVQQLPDNPERFDNFYSVAGSEGFNSGTRSWDVEVGDNTSWEVGALVKASERVQTRGAHCWFIEFYKRQYKARSIPGADTELSLKQNPKKIRVQLDWNKGTLSFSDPDTNTHIHTFTHTFTNTLFPYIGTWKAVPLTMSPWKVSVTMEPE